MAREDPDDTLKDDDLAEGDTADQVRAGGAGALAAGVPGVVAGGLSSTIGAAIGGEMAARDLIEDEGVDTPSDADITDSPDTFTGGGATSAGQDDTKY
jgi:hypothetical protein